MAPEPGEQPLDFRPESQADLVERVSGSTRVQHNLAALRLLRDLEERAQPANAAEQQILAKWSSWGAVPQVFDPAHEEYADTRSELHLLLSPVEYRAAERTTINAHYTDHAYASAMWQTLQDLGLRGGTVLEPGCGAGVFLGTAPPGVSMIGIEVDPVTAGISQRLHPSHVVYPESFADTQLADGAFDAVIGNVPFADIRLHDPRHNPARHTIHNHFLLKSVALTRPGGYVVALTSRYTLDAGDEQARRDLHKMADLIGAVRLPTGAHRAAAGTDAVTDLLVLRRRPEGEAPADPTWLTANTHTTADGRDYRLNDYFHAHPGHVLGDIEVGNGMYGGSTLTVRHTGESVATDLGVALSDIAGPAPLIGGDSSGITTGIDTGGDWLDRAIPLSPEPVVARVGDPSTFEGFTRYDETTATFTRTVAGRAEDLPVPGTQIAETRALLDLRDTVTTLLTLEAGSQTDGPGITEARARLNEQYEAYVTRYGPLNRVTLSQGRPDPTGTPTTRRLFPAAVRRFRADPFAPPVLALETYDEASGTAAKATIFTERVVAPREPRTTAATPTDALAISLDTLGEVDITHVANLLGVEPDQALQALHGSIFHDPRQDKLVTAEEYLSGNVRTKLAQAEEAALENPSLRANADALRDVQPVDLGPDEIDARLGAPWIPDSDITAFLRETLDDRQARAEHGGGSLWAVSGTKWSVAATSTWGTDRMDAITLTGRLLRQQAVIVRDVVMDGDTERRVVNPDATAAAQEKAGALGERFSEWVWQDPARAHRLATVYNETFNAIRLRDYDTSHLTFPGLARGWTPMSHQRVAVARMVAEPAVGLFHEVGAGKTAEMVMGVMELKRLGLVRKPAIVVPNHMLEQFSREFLQLYPQANILAAGTENLAKDSRRMFVGKIATGDWDAVVMTRGAFQRLPVSAQAERKYAERSLDELRTQLDNARAAGTKTLTVKTLQKAVARGEERLKANLDTTRDSGISFEQTGIDYLCVDELHDYKNLPIPSNIEGVTTTGVNKRATDLDMKLDLLRNAHGARVATGATATPIANSVAEAYVMQRYLRPDLLEAAGLTDFDSWAASFGEHVTEIELAPEGGGNYRTATRFAKFRNVPEMLALWHSSADIKTAADLDLPRPELAARPDGQRAPEVVAIQPSESILEYVKTLGKRAEAVRARMVTPDVDNMLKVSHDGRSAALDMRLVDPESGAGALFDVPTKLEVAAARIHRIWSEHRHDDFHTPGGTEISPNRGGLQLVFCDLGTPGKDKPWSVYDELKDKLTGHGLDPARVRFMHEANNDTEKARLFAQCRSGEVDVIIGSTQRMGVGTNIQERAIAAHHLDCPWRPSDVAQRDGRVLRQGNQNSEVQILRYVVEGSFDAYMWQAVERKSKFIAQVMRGTLDTREIDDIGDASLSFNEIKAIASGDPRVMDLAQAQQELVTLQRLQRGHARNQTQLRYNATAYSNEADNLEPAIQQIATAIERRTPTAGEAFTAHVGSNRYTRRSEAADALRAQIQPGMARLDPSTRPTLTLPDIMRLGGHTIDATLAAGLGSRHVTLEIRDVPVMGVRLTSDDLASTTHGPITKLENALARLEQNLDDKTRRVSHLRDQADQARHQIGAPFPRSADLEHAQTRVQTLQDAIDATATHRSGSNSDSSGITPDQAETNRVGLAKVRAAIAELKKVPGEQRHAHHDQRTGRPTPGRQR